MSDEGDDFLSSSASVDLATVGALAASGDGSQKGLSLDPDAVKVLACMNCGEPLDGPFCKACGQKHDDIRRPFFSFMKQLFDDVLSSDSRSWRTILYLIFMPGVLSRDYNDGRRASFLPPLRVYLILTVLFFLTLELTETAIVDVHVTPDEERIAEIDAQLETETARELANAMKLAGSVFPRVEQASLYGPKGAELSEGDDAEPSGAPDAPSQTATPTSPNPALQPGLLQQRLESRLKQLEQGTPVSPATPSTLEQLKAQRKAMASVLEANTLRGFAARRVKRKFDALEQEIARQEDELDRQQDALEDALERRTDLTEREREKLLDKEERSAEAKLKATEDKLEALSEQVDDAEEAEAVRQQVLETLREVGLARPAVKFPKPETVKTEAGTPKSLSLGDRSNPNRDDGPSLYQPSKPEQKPKQKSAEEDANWTVDFGDGKQHRPKISPDGHGIRISDKIPYFVRFSMFSPADDQRREGIREEHLDVIRDNPDLDQTAKDVALGFARVIQDPKGFNKLFKEQLPLATIAVIPIFALFLRWSHWGRQRFYMNQVVFALHFHSFMYVLLIGMVLAARFVSSDLLGPVFWLGISGYLVLALRSAQKQSFVRAFLKAGFIWVPYAVIMVAVTTVFIVWGLKEA